MNNNLEYDLDNLNHSDKNIRLQSLKNLKDMENAGKLQKPLTGTDVNNHIHTIYSFSPYSPTKAVWMGYQAGLCTAGIMDHDSIGGAEEFIEAGKVIGMPTTIGIECRVDFSNTPLAGRRINNPDQISNVYMAFHGIPHTRIKDVDTYFKPFREARIDRNRQMVIRINELLKSSGLTLDFNQDVLPLSQYKNGGTITERHILYALSLLLIDTYGKGLPLVDFLRSGLKLSVSPKLEAYLSDPENIHYAFDLLGVLKSDMVSQFYIPASNECPDVREVISFSKRVGAISAYAYLGDVGDSVTGDKKTQKFEDDYLEQLFDVLSGLRYDAVTYMPSRNTLAQLRRVKRLCNQHGLFQISGEDINSPRQPFICEALKNEEFNNLYTSTFALIGHELSATQDESKGMFSENTIIEYPALDERIERYAQLGKDLSGGIG